jgi:hypothetical protein
MRKYLFVTSMLLVPMAPASAQLSVGIGFQTANIGINLQFFPDLQPVPGYPVYYAPRLNSNYFFYDGMYWVYQGDNWYAGSWYNGPWTVVDPGYVPYFILRVPVRYYRQPPSYFIGWQVNVAPRWDQHWGSSWSQQRSGWDKWDRNSVPAPAPLPVYQRNYSGDRYPAAEQQQTLHKKEYRYEPREAVVRELQAPRAQGSQGPGSPPARDSKSGGSQDTNKDSKDSKGGPQSSPTQRSEPPAPPRTAPQPSDGKNTERSAPAQQPDAKNTQRSAPAQQPDAKNTQRSAPIQQQSPQPNKADAQRPTTEPKAKDAAPQDAKQRQPTSKEKDRDAADKRGQNPDR